MCYCLVVGQQIKILGLKAPEQTSPQEKDQFIGKLINRLKKKPSNSHGLRSGPSVGPYPPLRLVPTTEPTILQPQTQGPIINPTTA